MPLLQAFLSQEKKPRGSGEVAAGSHRQQAWVLGLAQGKEVKSSL